MDKRELDSVCEAAVKSYVLVSKYLKLPINDSFITAKIY